MAHLGSHRHLGNKRQYTPVFHDKPPEPFGSNAAPPSEWPLPKSRHSQPEDIGGLPKPFKRIRSNEEVDEPWRFSPSEAEQQDRYQMRSSPSRKDNFDDGGLDYGDDFGGGDDYRDDDSPPPPPVATSFPTLPLPFALPKPVPIVLPKPVPIRNLDAPQPASAPR